MKGQWFIISAVFVAFSMLAISSSFRSFLLLDSSSVAGYSEEYHFENLKAGLQRTIQLSDNKCEELTKNLNDYIYFAQQSKGRLGYVVDVFYEIGNCAGKEVRFNLILLQSEKAQIWEGLRPEIGQI